VQVFDVRTDLVFNKGVSSMAKKKKATRGKAQRPKKKKKGGRAARLAPRPARAARPLARTGLVAASKQHAVAAAVAAQLTADGRWPPNDLTKVMGTDYRYNQFTIGNFLAGVQVRLAASVPPLTFSFDSAFTIQALSMTVGQLIGAINTRTT
jgi:hypothetical protein